MHPAMKMFAMTLLILFTLCLSIYPQTSPITFGAVSRADLEMQPYPQEKGAEAVVLCDFASAKLIFNDGFKVEVTRHIRIKIFKPAGYDFGNVMIEFSKDDKLSELQASTYNLVNDKPEEMPVGKKQFYEESTSLWENTMRFALPQVREGSIIEYSYKLTQDEIRRFVPFRFQRSIPVRHVEFWAVIPEFFKYSVNYRGYDKVIQSHDKQKGYYDTYSTAFDVYNWIGNHLPPLQPETYMPENGEYFPGVSFSLSSVDFPGGRYFEVAPSYKKLTTDLLTNSDFGSQLNNTALFNKDVQKVIAGRTTAMEKAQALYDHVKDRIKWNGFDRRIPYESIRIAYRDKTGNNADINTILINMLRTAGLSADPVVLSTRENGSLNPFMALTGDLDYMVCLAMIDGKEYLLDGTDKFRPLGMLPFKCLNKEGWVLSEKNGKWIKLLGNEKNHMREFYDLTLDENGTIKGLATITLDGYDAVEFRKLIYNQSEEGIRQEKLSSFGNMKFSSITTQNLLDINKPLVLTFTLELDHLVHSGKEFSYFRPVYNLFESLENNWIKEERVYPIDLGCPEFSSLTCVYHLPESFKISELPKSVRLVLPNDDASFTYKISSAGNMLSVDGELSVSKTWIEPREYPAFREFFTQIVKKTNEMVILQTGQIN